MNIQLIPIKRFIVQAIFIARFLAAVPAEVWRQFVAVVRDFRVIKGVCIRDELLWIFLLPHGRRPLQGRQLLSLLFDSYFPISYVARVMMEGITAPHRPTIAFAILALILLLVDPLEGTVG